MVIKQSVIIRQRIHGKVWKPTFQTALYWLRSREGVEGNDGHQWIQSAHVVLGWRWLFMLAQKIEKSSEKNFHYEIKENSCIKVQRGKATEQGWILINSGWCKAERVTPLGLEWNKRDRVSNKIKLKLLLSSTCSLQEFDQWLHSCFLIF